MIPSQMLKDTLEDCILKIISRQETYDYEVSQQLQQYGFVDISEGMIHPLLLRLEKSGLITAEYREPPLRPRRKYFFLPVAGRAELDGFHADWKEFEQVVNNLFIHGGDNDESRGQAAQPQ